MFAASGRLFFRNRRGKVSGIKIAGLGLVGIGVLYVLLVRGLFQLDIAGPWVQSALERQLGPGHKVEIGSTHLEHDESGAPVLRVNQIRVFGPGDKLIASAPSAEVGLDGASMLVGNIRVRRIDLVGAETTVQVGTDGRVTIIAGRDASPVAPGTIAQLGEGHTESIARGASEPIATGTVSVASKPFHFPQLVGWLDSFEKSGFDGVALSEIGFKQGSLVVENAAGRTWRFSDIDIHLTRYDSGGLLFKVASSSPDKPWNLTATVGAVQDSSRAIDIVASNLDPGDILLAAGLSDFDYIAETPISGILRAQIAQDGKLKTAMFRATAGGGRIGVASDPDVQFRLEGAQVQGHFDPVRSAVVVDPLVVQLGANRLAFSASVQAPQAAGTIWPVSIHEGLLFLSSGRPGETPLVLDNVSINGHYDPAEENLVIHRGSIAGATTGGAFSGSVSFGSEPMLALGIAASQMPVSAAKRLWPSIVAPGTRSWAVEHVEQGIIERLSIALHVPLESIGKRHFELPDSAVRFEMTAIGGAFRITDDAPLISGVEASVVVTGRAASVHMPRAQVATPQGRQIVLSDGMLDVADHVPPNPSGTIRFRLQGPADAIAEMAATDPVLKDVAGFTIDPAAIKGSFAADVNLELIFRETPRAEDIHYVVEGEAKNLTADRLVRGERVEGVNAKVTLTGEIIEVRGEGRIGGAPSRFEYRKSKVADDAEFRVTTTLDDRARARFGVNLAPSLTGPVGVRAQGRTTKSENRIDVEADLTAAVVNDLVPGWQKPAGRSAKGNFRLVEHKNGIKLEQLSITGSDVALEGSVDLDNSGDIVTAHFPKFQLSDGDKASLRADRTSDGTFRVSVRGDILDARSAIRSLLAAPAQAAGDAAQRPRDLDLELQLGAATGHNGEVARQVDLRISRRRGEIRNFALLGKIGRDQNMVGELRKRQDGRPALFVTTGDAGAFFRFSDFYTRMHGGEAWIVIDPPTPEGAPQDGLLSVRDFVIRGEPALDRMQAAAPEDAPVVTGATRPSSQGMPFLNMRVDFNRTSGRFNIREGLIYGPNIGATVNGMLDFANDRVHLRGTYIPAYGLNNLFGHLPIVGLFLGGPREGLIAITFEIVGPASGPTLRVNPMSAVAPGFLRKLFEFRGAIDTPAAPFER